MTDTSLHAVYGSPPADLVEVPPGAVQMSPSMPEAGPPGRERPALETVPAGSLAGITMLAPPGTLERRYALAAALRALGPGGILTALAPKTAGGSRLRGELEAFGASVVESSRRHHRICVLARPEAPLGWDEAIAAGAPRFVEALGLWSQPGLFSWDRIDPGSALLAERIRGLSGRGADLGCGTGFLARAVLASPRIVALTGIDVDRRAVACARRNVTDPRASFVWADLRQGRSLPADLDFVVMNPPFHDNGAEDRALGQSFIRAAAGALRRGGTLWLVANRHLPYEAVLSEAFGHVSPALEAGGYKIHEARK